MIGAGLVKGALGVLTDPKKLLKLGAVVLAMFLAWEAFKFVNTALDNAALVEQQKITIQLKDAEIETQIQLRLQAEEAQRISDRAREAAEQRESEIRQIRDAILQSGDERDGGIAPVLGDTLRALRERDGSP